MSTTMKTPGVYIQELDAFGNSVVPVPTAVPAFIGYTEKTTYNGKNLINKAVKVTSLAEYLSIFGSNAPEVKYALSSTISSEGLDELLKRVTSTEAALTAADKVVEDAAADVTEEQTKAAADAKTAKEKAAAELVEVNKDPVVKAFLDAKTVVDDAVKAGTAVTDEQQKTLKDANTAYNKVTDAADFVNHGFAYALTQKGINFRLYSAMKFFYENGGAACFVMSVGAYDYSKTSISDTTALTEAITLLEKEMEPTMLVIPDSVEVFDDTVTDETDDDYLKNRYKDAYSLQMAMINHCGEMMDRIAILDVPGGFKEPVVGTKSFEQFRSSVEPSNPKFKSYAAVYYPWMHTTIYQSSEISYKNIDTDTYAEVQKLLTSEFTDPETGVVAKDFKTIVETFKTDPSDDDLKAVAQSDIVLQNLSSSYKILMNEIKGCMNLLAPSAGMAGIYTSVDNNDGVWKAPANVGVQSTVAPSINIDHAQQEDLNVPISGKSICAIRAFVGRGNLVWGARTMDGNSNDWRYVNVRRTLIFLEESVKDAAKAFVFAPNDASTWVTVKSMISNFLIGIWKQGGLVGPKPADAFSVSVGLGSTMTNDDIQNGIMRVSVKVAVSHPAEFIEITFQQQMQKA